MVTLGLRENVNITSYPVIFPFGELGFSHTTTAQNGCIFRGTLGAVTEKRERIAARETYSSSMHKQISAFSKYED